MGNFYSNYNIKNEKKTKRNKKKETTNKQEKIYPSINIIFTFISINNKNNNFF